MSDQTQQLPLDMTVGELRKDYGPSFADGYGDQDPIGPVLGRAGVMTVDEYVDQQQKA